MAGMAVSASTGVMNSLLSKLSMLLTDQYKQLKGVRKDIEFLSRELIDMNAALETLADMEKLDVQTRVWRDKIREMAYDIEDCIDVFMHHLVGEGDDKDGLFRKTSRKIRKLRVRYQIANKIQEIKARVEEHSKSRDRYKTDISISKSAVVEVDPRLPALFEEAKRLVGIDGPREEITKWLMKEGESDFGQLEVVSIVGFGGLGKTTLANQVYTKIKDNFECKAFVSVSRSPDMPKILKDILSGVVYASMEMADDVQKLMVILRAHLLNKRYLIVIDDLWSTKAWDTIQCAFVRNDKCSRVMTTTRIQDVATACCSPCNGHVYQMQPLNEGHSRSLFLKRVFGTEDGCPHQFKEISEVMLRKCKGVPLAITSIASLLANQTMHVETWEKTRDSLGSELDTNPTLEWMRHVLSLSYNDLSPELKTCLLYLGAYPEDHAIRKFDLVTKWIAEGFVREKHGLDLEEVAENCFNELVNRSMIQPSFGDYFVDEVQECRVHDLMLDLIISKCIEENFITIVDRKFNINGGPQVRRISHQFNNTNIARRAERFSMSQVRSYISFPAADCMPLLSKFEVLRVLDLDRGRVHSQSMSLDLSAINHIFLLRYLKVGGFNLELPKKFGNLKHLMTLHMSRADLSPTSNQSSDFTSLSSLRHLSLPVTGKPVALRNGLSKLCNLRTLWCFDIGTNSVECIRDLGELTNLRDLSLYYSSPGDVEDNFCTILAASLEKLGNNLRSLYGLVEIGARATHTQVWSNCLTRPRHLQRFYLNGLMPKVPNWIAHAGRLAYLRKLTVQELWSDDVQLLAQLPCLVFLRLRALSIPEKCILIHTNTFTSLKCFEFACQLSCLTFEPAAMPRLQSLMIRFDGLRQGAVQPQKGSCLLAGIEHLASLKKIHIDVSVKCSLGSNLESECRKIISRHPKSQAIQISVHCTEYDEEGNYIHGGRQQSQGSKQDYFS